MAFAHTGLAAGWRRTAYAVRGRRLHTGYLSFGGSDEESFSGFGSKIAVVEVDGVIFSPKQIVPQLKSLFPLRHF
jgi:hypothetical protein